VQYWGGGLAGLMLFSGATLQQIGLVYPTAGKAGFITGLYVIIVPLMGLFLGHWPGWGGWVGACFTETITLDGIKGAIIPILYGGVLSVGIAYTLQVVAQRHAPPLHAAIILSLEAVFAAPAGWLVLGEMLSLRV
jgi:drug/metabolite transporter (DMT)-like permease